MPNDSVRLLQGSVDVLILKTLSRGPLHGYGVSNWIRQLTAGVLGIKDAALYQALHRLEARGWIEAEWGVSENNRRAKYYQLTKTGWKHLRAETVSWRRYTEAVAKVLDFA